MSYLDAPDANAVVTYAAGALATIPNGAWTVAIMFRRTGTTTDGYENLFALETSGNQVITNFGTDATSSPYALSCGQGGASRTFTGMDDLVDADDYLFVVRKTNGTVNPRANLYRFDEGSPAWDGWVTGAGSGDFENRSDTIDHAKSHNQQGGFPLRGGIYLIAVWDDALAEADVTNASTGLHIGVQEWLDIATSVGPVTLLRPGEANPVVDESASGTSDETSRSGTLNLETGWPLNFDGAFGAGGVTGEVAGELPVLDGALVGTGTAAGTVTGDLPAPDGALAGVGTATGVIAGELPMLDGPLAGAGTAAGIVAGELPVLDGAFDGAGTVVVLLSGNLPEFDGQLTGTVVSGAAGVVAGELPALDGSLAGAGAAAGILGGDLPELIGPILGTVVGGVTRRLKALPTTTVDIYAPAVGSPDEWSGDRGSETLAAGGVVASIIEQDRTVNDPRTGTPRVVRSVTGRVPSGTPIETTSRVVDAEGRVYAVSAVRQVRNPVWTGDIVLGLVRTDQASP